MLSVKTSESRWGVIKEVEATHMLHMFQQNHLMKHLYLFPTLVLHLEVNHEAKGDGLSIRASHLQFFMLFQAVNTVKLNFKAGLFSSTFQFEHSFLAKSQC